MREIGTCISSQDSSTQNCSTYNTTGVDMSVSLSPPISYSGNYVYGGITNPVDSTDTTAAAIMAQVSKEVSFLFPVLGKELNIPMRSRRRH